jgi:hypothetical protein
MQFLRSLFGGGPRAAQDTGLYYYVRPRGCDEVVRVRIHPYNDLSEHDGGGYFVRKVVMGSTCFQRVELELEFNGNRVVTDTRVSGGELVDAAAYEAWVRAHPPA